MDGMSCSQNGNRNQRPAHPPLHLSEGDHVVQEITSARGLIEACRLRHKVFCEELGWVPVTDTALESDRYDEGSISLGVFDSRHSLKGYLRVVVSDYPFMLENEFVGLARPDYELRKQPDTVEISRLCIDPEARNDRVSGNFGLQSISLLLYKGVYHWCLLNNVRYLYLVVEEKVFRLLCLRGFPCRLIGEPKTMPDGVVAVAAMLDWRLFEENNKLARPIMFAWFNQVQSPLVPEQLPQRAIDLQRPVFS